MTLTCALCVLCDPRSPVCVSLCASGQSIHSAHTTIMSSAQSSDSKQPTTGSFSGLVMERVAGSAASESGRTDGSLNSARFFFPIGITVYTGYSRG
jgi:hypothetical protein